MNTHLEKNGALAKCTDILLIKPSYSFYLPIKLPQYVT